MRQWLGAGTLAVALAATLAVALAGPGAAHADANGRIAPAPTAPAVPAPAVSYRVSNPIPPRTQWNANYGYCGETSFISAGLNYGTGKSLRAVRTIASWPATRSRIIWVALTVPTLSVMHVSSENSA